MITPKPCPFCGEMPRCVDPEKDDYYVWCANDICPLFEHDIDVSIWNLRPTWQDIATAPKGGGAELVSDPNWVNPPKILLLFEGGQVGVGYWDWYYADGGRGYEGGLAWIDPISGERLDLSYGVPTKWMPIPDDPVE